MVTIEFHKRVVSIGMEHMGERGSSIPPMVFLKNEDDSCVLWAMDEGKLIQKSDDLVGAWIEEIRSVIHSNKFKQYSIFMENKVSEFVCITVEKNYEKCFTSVPFYISSNGKVVFSNKDRYDLNTMDSNPSKILERIVDLVTSIGKKKHKITGRVADLFAPPAEINHAAVEQFNEGTDCISKIEL